MKPSSVVLALTCGSLCLACSPRTTPGQQTPGVLGRFDFESPAATFEMPGRLDEISGLAITADGRLFGHDDERGTVHEIDRAGGAVGKRFSIGDPPLEDDFEGLAVAGERFFLITSAGMLYEFREVGDRETSPHRITDLGVGGACEVEGLDYDPGSDALLVACKVAISTSGSLVVHRIPLDPARRRTPPLEIARAKLADFGLRIEFHPSSIALSPAGTLLLASADPEAIIEVDGAGRVIAGVDLAGRGHPQAEGLAFAPDGTLYVADEQNGQPAKVTAYRPICDGGTP